MAPTASGRTVRRRSYADWISRALDGSHNGALSLAAIYHWMSLNVPGLYEKRNLHSAKGWKNAVRHTLSVNPRFRKSPQPNARAALWSLVPIEETQEEAPEVSTAVEEADAPPPPVLPPAAVLDLRPKQTLELHQQDGTVRRVTVPRALPIQVLTEYRIVPVMSTPSIISAAVP